MQWWLVKRWSHWFNTCSSKPSSLDQSLCQPLSKIILSDYLTLTGIFCNVSFFPHFIRYLEYWKWQTKSTLYDNEVSACIITSVILLETEITMVRKYFPSVKVTCSLPTLIGVFSAFKQLMDRNYTDSRDQLTRKMLPGKRKEF